MRRLLLPVPAVLALLLVPVACGSDDPTGPELGPADVVVLFVGNSLTYTNSLPAVVSTVAAAAGVDVAVSMVAQANFALEDHWWQGIAGAIQSVQPDIVVMQQGPSSLPENQAHLAAWTDSLTRVVREAGAEPALFMVWPSLPRFDFFDDVRDAYLWAAEGVDGTFIPAGEAFKVLYERQEPGLTPYGGDGFHPTVQGTVLSAMVIVGTLFDVGMTGLPAEMPASPRSGLKVSLSAHTAEVLQFLADSTVAAWRSPPPGVGPARAGRADR